MWRCKYKSTPKILNCWCEKIKKILRSQETLSEIRLFSLILLFGKFSDSWGIILPKTSCETDSNLFSNKYFNTKKVVLSKWFKWKKKDQQMICNLLTYLRSIFPSYKNLPIDLQWKFVSSPSVTTKKTGLSFFSQHLVTIFKILWCLLRLRCT